MRKASLLAIIVLGFIPTHLSAQRKRPARPRDTDAKDTVIPKGTEITAYVNGDIKLEREKFKGN